LGVGGWAGYHEGTQSAAKQAAATTAAPAAVPVLADLNASQIAGVSSITREPDSENVEVRFYRMVPETAFGTLDDPQIRQLLLLGARNAAANPAVHDDSVDLLAQECQAGHECDGGPIRNALMVALRYDKDTHVRSKALAGLEPYNAMDTRVRDAILETLLKDPDPGIRSQAIGLLTPVEADSSVRDVLQTVANQDENPHIRNISRQYLEQVAQIQ
ncbi:MAG TPA: HEAT repeat domain-containing protein, partial [Chloroflexota bacterium]|nr:HEAT repeat domain-containing protein [Chloroflexota bacterium]